MFTCVIPFKQHIPSAQTFNIGIHKPGRRYQCSGGKLGRVLNYQHWGCHSCSWLPFRQVPNPDLLKRTQEVSINQTWKQRIEKPNFRDESQLPGWSQWERGCFSHICKSQPENPIICKSWSLQRYKNKVWIINMQDSAKHSQLQIGQQKNPPADHSLPQPGLRSWLITWQQKG